MSTSLAHRWDHVPWITYEDSIDKAEAVRLFGQDMADRLTYTQADDHEPAEETQKNARNPIKARRNSRASIRFGMKTGASRSAM